VQKTTIANCCSALTAASAEL